MMRRIKAIEWGIVVAASVAFCQVAVALWAYPGGAPLERLLPNVQRYVQQHPNDAHGHYILGRLHSLAFARGMKTSVLYCPNKPLDFSPYEPFFAERQKELSEPDNAALSHLAASIRHYRIAVRLKPKEALYWLGLAWVLEQGIKFADKLPAPFLEKPKIVAAEEWRKEALNAYRQAFRLSVEKDLAQSNFLRGTLGLPSGSIAQEAGEAILRLQKGRRLGIRERWELAKVEKAVATLKAKPRAITPIIFPLHRPLPLSALVAKHSAIFDLNGDGIKER